MEGISTGGTVRRGCMGEGATGAAGEEGAPGGGGIGTEGTGEAGAIGAVVGTEEEEVATEAEMTTVRAAGATRTATAGPFPMRIADEL